jgi:hypothetical protein
MAAVTGRQIELDLAQALDPTMNIESWLDSCAEASVLEVQEGRWRFAHDKLREGLLLNVPVAEQKNLHRRVAETIERVHAAELSPFYPRLGHHFALAGEVEQAIRYLNQAGDKA